MCVCHADDKMRCVCVGCRAGRCGRMGRPGQVLSIIPDDRREPFDKLLKRIKITPIVSIISTDVSAKALSVPKQEHAHSLPP